MRKLLRLLNRKRKSPKLKSIGAQFIVVGLGNPGPEYVNTRHNAGFWVCDQLAHNHGVRFSGSGPFCHAWINVAGKKVLLVKPETFMNRSGIAVARANEWLKGINELIVIYDDIDLPPGKLRIKSQGSAGGHKGMKSVLSVMGDRDFYRVRVGVGRPDSDIVSWVLSAPNDTDAEMIADAVDRACDAVECIIDQGIERAMAQHN